MPSEQKSRIQVLQGTLDLIILRTLRSMGPQHAYGIAALPATVFLDSNGKIVARSSGTQTVATLTRGLAAA